MDKILLNSRRSKTSRNIENVLPINIISNNSMLPVADINGTINEYEQYLKEKKESQKYRLTFNISPICTNVLFNNVSEIVLNEGSDDCIFFGKNALGNVKVNKFLEQYCTYKGIKYSDLNRYEMIKDTGFSHSDAGGVVYHCGFDIFNNHTLRKKEFNIINKLKTNNKYRNVFNTLLDYQRDYEGNLINDYPFNEFDRKKTYKHLYIADNILSFEDSINENLIEKNGWIGFINPTTLNVPNYVTNNANVSINKCMNNNKSCEMIDMYPDRSLFSFIPKINKYRDNRVEYNWDYCLTYPCENYYDNELVTYKSIDHDITINGLECKIDDEIFINDAEIGEYIGLEDGELISLRTIIKNNFTVNSLVNIVLIGEINGQERIIELPNNEKVISVGKWGENKEYIFKIYSENIVEYLNKYTRPSEVQIRVRKCNNNNVCKYYFRKFRRIPNFKNTNVYVDDNINEDEIKCYSNKNFNSILNNLGFSRTIYNDFNTQIIFNDDIELKGIKDNLGREISEIYLTIVKNNKGNKEWYDEKKYSSSAITFSHCFGDITSGIDIKDKNILDYNIHKLHNISNKILSYYESPSHEILHAMSSFKKIFNDKKSPKTLEKNITIHGVENNNEFLGDIVEFNEYSLQENILENVYHRFNTRQREYLNDNEFRDIIIDEIKSDDLDINQNFSAVTRNYNKLYDELFPININPEGYYYKPHYLITLKKFKDEIKQGSHTKITYTSYKKNNNNYEIITSKNYYLEPMTKIILYNKVNNKKLIGDIISVDGKYNTIITLNVDIGNDSFDDFTLYKPNTEKPSTAYELNDGTGRYLWKEFLEDHEYNINDDISKYVFTNNAHYINKHIVFYLHRQDPDGSFGLSNSSSIISTVNNLSVNGITNEYDNIKTMINELEEGILC